MSLIPLTLQSDRETWKLSPASLWQIPGWDSLLKKVHKANNHTCQYCGFQSFPKDSGESYQFVHFLDHDIQNQNLSNLVTACHFCYLVLHPGYAGMMNLGTMIWLPELTQVELNHLVRSAFIAMNIGDVHEGSSRALYSSLDARSLYLEEVLSEHARNPQFVGQTMIDIAPKKMHHKIFEGLRMLPSNQCNDASMEYFATTAYADFHPSKWQSLINDE